MTPANRPLRLEEALALLIQAEAAYLVPHVETDRRLTEADRLFAVIMQVLGEHTRLLEQLPERLLEVIRAGSYQAGPGSGPARS